MADTFEKPMNYDDSKTQLIPFYFQRKALIDLKRDMYFGQLADTTSMPKHYGKTIKKYQ